MNVTHEITSMIAKTTKSGNRMWECQCKTGERVWVVDHTDPTKDTYGLFNLAGFSHAMWYMAEGSRLEWKQFPIQAELRKDGDFWRVVGVADCLEGQTFDVPYVPKPEYWKQKAELVSILLLSSNVVCWDTETTGTDSGSEIISLGCVNGNLSEEYSWTLRPNNLDRVALTSNVHQILPEQLAQAPDFSSAVDEISFALHDEVWLGYNIKFDIQMLDQECERRDMIPLLPKAVFDVMELVAWYRGEWDEANARWKVCKLVEAAEALGVEFHGEAHDALNDAITTMMLVRKMAGV